MKKLQILNIRLNHPYMNIGQTGMSNENETKRRQRNRIFS